MNVVVLMRGTFSLFQHTLTVACPEAFPPKRQQVGSMDAS